ncbi:MAG TPA: multidrug ABC transporter ATP-binding protein [Clostridiales bacterium]|nr:multidrug ABC transporter ATP-binding protein [Candidatus Apopatosoma intestinale]
MRPGGGPRRGMSMIAEKPKNMKKTLSRLLKYIVTNKFMIIMLVASVIISALLNLAGPSIQGEALKFLTPSTDEGGKLIILEDGTVKVDFAGMTRLLVLLGAVYLLSSLFTYIQGHISAKLSQKTVYRMRGDLFRKIEKLPIKYIDNHPHGDIMSRMTNDIENISNTVSNSVTSLISGIITIIGAFSLMLYHSWQMTLVALVTIPLTVLVTTKLTKYVRRYFMRQQQLLGAINSQVEESVTGYKTVVAFGHENEIKDEFNRTGDELRTAGIKAEIFGGVMGPLMNIIGNVGFLLIVICGALFTMKGLIGITTIYVFIQYSKQFTRPINEVANQYTSILNAITGAERVFEIMDQNDETDEGKKVLLPADIKGNISFRNICFSYVQSEPVLKNFNLEISSGQKIAIVGKTGSGKTTIINLLTRFYETDSGKILLDGTDIREITKASLRKNIAIVLQDTVLFSDTVGANIRYGRPEASEAETEAAAKAAKAHDFITRMPEGYDTVLDESGGNISQGQKQLLTIARAILADPKILILDEATSSVDTRTEMDIQSAMINLMQGRTTLIIAHRLSTIRDADKIIVLDDGRIVEAGNHNELIAAEGVYYGLYMSQFAGIET